MKLINGIDVAEWANNHRSLIRATIMDTDILAWRCQSGVFELYIVPGNDEYSMDGLKTKRIMKPRGVERWDKPEEPESVFLGEITHEKDLLEERIVATCPTIKAVMDLFRPESNGIEPSGCTDRLLQKLTGSKSIQAI